jgi:Flp pilus assembly protein TadG
VLRPSPHSGIQIASSCFRIDQSAVSAVEFALILPVMLTLWAGMAEMAHAIDNWRKVTLLSRTVADLTSQGDPSGTATIQSATMSDILAASSAVMRPFNSANVKIVVSAMEVNLATSPLNPKVCSSVANATGTARTTGIASDLTIPLGFQTTGERYVMAEVSMPYTPMIGGSLVKLVGGINGSITLKASFPWPTRGGQAYNGNAYSEVILPNGVQCP